MKANGGFTVGMNEMPSAERTHIGIFGKRNAGKSSLINAMTNQYTAIVSDVKGTTTDPVLKAMEILPLGPVMIIDTPGIDDSGELGLLRIKKSYEVLNRTDIALVVVDEEQLTEEDITLIERIKAKDIPYIVVYNKLDIRKYSPEILIGNENQIAVSAENGTNIAELRLLIAKKCAASDDSRKIIGDKLAAGDKVVLVVPIDSAAPKGRLILPQQQTIRDILDCGASAIVTRDTELADIIKKFGDCTKLVITDSQVFKKVDEIVPENIPLTSFSILMARYKGNLDRAIEGVAAVEKLRDGDKILISEGCTHHRQCEDIGSVKIPKMLTQYTERKLEFEFSSGMGFPDDLSKYSLIIHCGGCMLNEREMRFRSRCAAEKGIPMTNYGILLAYLNGILERSLEIFPETAKYLN